MANKRQRPRKTTIAAAAVQVLDHAVGAAGLSILRAKTTTPDVFRRHLQDVSVLLFVEAARGWETRAIRVETPLASCAGAVLAKPIVLVPILRAGLGMLEGIQRVVPDASVGHIGLYRDAETLRPVSYYERLPVNVSAAEVLLLDPMLATGNSACEAASILKAQGARSIQFLCVVACPAGIQQLQTEHPDVPIIAAAIDPELNDHGYIVPGLGDAGDRYFGTG
jgi:uracil phosphoribosyltransferase